MSFVQEKQQTHIPSQENCPAGLRCSPQVVNKPTLCERKALEKFRITYAITNSLMHLVNLVSA
jgi:hypothetical protein